MRLMQQHRLVSHTLVPVQGYHVLAWLLPRMLQQQQQQPIPNPGLSLHIATYVGTVVNAVDAAAAAATDGTTHTCVV